MATWLVYGGKTGWVGGLLMELLRAQGDIAVAAEARLESREAVEAEMDRVKPTYVVNAAGKTGRPNIDWCETNKVETFRANVLGALSLIDVCEVRGIPHLLYSTGCVYTYEKDGPHAMGTGIGFKETDKHNFNGSYYSHSKGLLDEIITATNFKCLLMLRVRLPLGDDFNHRSLITKLLAYDKLVDIPNSITVLHNMLPISIKMMRDGRRGIYNFTQVGTISHGELMTLYKEIVDPTIVWSHFSLEEQAKVIVAPRSQCHLDATKLKSEYPELKTAHEAVREAFTILRQHVDNGAPLPPKRNGTK